jgi:hypothetical protein
VAGFLDPDRALDERLMVDNTPLTKALGALIMAGRPAPNQPAAAGWPRAVRAFWSA